VRYWSPKRFSRLSPDPRPNGESAHHYQGSSNETEKGYATFAGLDGSRNLSFDLNQRGQLRCPEEALVKIRERFKALVVRQHSEHRWVCVVWIAADCLLGFYVAFLSARWAEDYMPTLAFFLALALIGYVQLRFPTRLGWALMFACTVAGCFFGLLLSIVMVLIGLTRNLWYLPGAILLFAVMAGLLFGLIREWPSSK
jgi:hypothetical protein